ncbi:MAG: hypothetical protein H7301_08020 [Cryobacterium sp.]|nr:hypothetical protein [Oligoflexia bacterium]
MLNFLMLLISTPAFAATTDGYRSLPIAKDAAPADPGQQHPVPTRSGEVHGEPVWTMLRQEKKGKQPSLKPVMTEFSVAPGLGGATLSLKARFNGEEIQVFPERNIAEFNSAFAQDPNAPFKYFNTPLFPLTNRLLPKNFSSATSLKLGESFQADVEGISVRMVANNKNPAVGSIAHHLHGLLFSEATNDVDFQAGEKSTIRSRYRNFFRGNWVGEAEVKVEQGIFADGVFHYQIKAKNNGKGSIPMGFGSHSYFSFPGGRPEKIRLIIPAKRTAVIDNLENVLPTGNLRKIEAKDDPLNFNRNAPGKISGKFIDNYFMLEPGEDVYLVDSEKGLKFKLHPSTKNIIGVQVFYPAKGNVVAIELVTNHPDPRRELWGKEPTGMRVYAPGEDASYGYTIEILPLAPGDLMRNHS